MNMLDITTIGTLDMDGLLKAVVDMYDLIPADRAAARIKIKARAKALGCLDDFEEYIKAMNATDGGMGGGGQAEPSPQVILRRAPDGRVMQTIENFRSVMEGDPYYRSMRRNLMTGRVEIERDGEIRAWNEVENSRSKEHCSAGYWLRGDQCHQDAFNIVSSERAYNPLVELLESLEWDGKPRIEELLIKWMKCEDCAYSREVSRLIFAGGVHRAFRPGCKFDEVPILIGEKQGEGKSTFIKWLAMDEKYFNDNISEFDGQKGIEALQGKWIVEISEMLAFKRAKEVESIKAYISRQTDYYRAPYERFADDYPRRCIFIGTSNSAEILSDRTGNRRFYPIIIHSNGFELNDHRDEIQEYISQCWAEAVALFRENKLHPYANRQLMDVIKAAQESAVEEDGRIGLIEKYLKYKPVGYEVCTYELWYDALGNDPDLRKPNINLDLKPLKQLMGLFDEWKRSSKRVSTTKYGQQRVWIKQKSAVIIEDDDKMPFED